MGFQIESYNGLVLLVLRDFVLTLLDETAERGETSAGAHHDNGRGELRWHLEVGAANESGDANVTNG